MIDVKWKHDKSAGKVVATIEVDEETFFRARFTGMDTNLLSRKLETLAKIAKLSESGSVIYNIDELQMSMITTGMQSVKMKDINVNLIDW